MVMFVTEQLLFKFAQLWRMVSGRLCLNSPGNKRKNPQLICMISGGF